MLKRGTPVIVNDVDCPEARMVAILTSYCAREGMWRARYLSAFPYRATCAEALDTPTPLAEFGVALVIERDRFRCVPMAASRARYRDGKPRRWQDRCPGRWHDLRSTATAWRPIGVAA